MSGGQSHPPAKATAGDVARRSYGKLVAFLAARTRDVAAAEDALSDAFVAALAEWPRTGIPSNPEAWLMTVARRKSIDVARHRHRGEAVTGQLQILSEGLDSTHGSGVFPDQRLALMFVCAHPAIDVAVRSPLILQVILGLNATAIASAFLMSPATMAQRLVRAKKKIEEVCIPFRVPEREELRDRLGTVLDAIYAAFAEGWVDACGTDAARRDLAEEAIYLGRLLVELLRGEPEALGLLALMLHAEARRPARRNAQGEYVPLAAQDSALWNMEMIREAESLLLQASGLASIGRYQIEAAIQSAHVFRRRAGTNNWEDVFRLYDALLAITDSPVVVINRALAIAETKNSSAALQTLKQIEKDPRLAQYQPYWAARAELLAKSGEHAEAIQAYEIAIGLERDPAVRRFLQHRQSAASENLK
jgi:RNA polymerase sigma-70 factor (ECF subfamily)